MKVKELLANLANVNPELEVFTGTGDEYLNAVTENDVNVQEAAGVQILTIQGQGEMVKLPGPFCQRCTARLSPDGEHDEMVCTDVTCPFSNHKQDCPVGWTGHPDHTGDFFCTCRE